MTALFKGMLLLTLIAIGAVCATVPATPIALTAPAAIPTPIVSATSTATLAPSATLAPTATPVPTATAAPMPTSLPPLAIDDTWATYTNAKYAFAFRYPADWKLKEITGSVNSMRGHAVYLLHPTDPTVRLIIAFKRAAEDQPITPTGMGGGDL